MSTQPADSLARHLRRLLPPAGLAALSDRQLLERFAAGRDEAAFAALVERHGRLVLGVCRRLLGDLHDAEDVFQATFLVLARKPGAIRRREAIGSFLHGVAARLARKARARRERRPPQPRETPISPDVPDAVARQEVCQVVDEELRRLPAHYRTPLVLCYLEGKSRQEAAAVLGCSEGAVKGKLERGRELLRARLLRRGVAAVPAALAALEQPAGAVPAAWMAAVRAAIAAEHPTGAAAALADGLLRAMRAAKMKMAAGLLLLGVLGLGLGMAALPAEAPQKDRRCEPPPTGAIAFAGFARKGQLVTARQCFSVYCATCHAEPITPLRNPPLVQADAALALAPDGRSVALGNRDGTVSVWELASGGRRVTLRSGTDRPLTALAFAPDGKVLAGGQDRYVHFWDVATGRELETRQGPSLDLADASLDLLSAALSPDGRKVLSASRASAALAWDVIGLRPEPRTIPLEERELAACWDDLRGEAGRAWKAMNRLETAPRQAVALLNEHLRPAAPVDAKPPPEDLRTLRCLEILEQIPTAEARALLEGLAGGGAEAIPTRQPRGAGLQPAG